METVTETIKSDKGQIRDLRMQIIAKGLKWNDIEDLDLESLQALDAGLKVEYVNDPKEVLHRVVENVVARRAWHKVCEIEGAQDLIERWDSWNWDNSTNTDDIFMMTLLEGLVEKKKAKLLDRQNRQDIGLSNRALYLPKMTVTLGVTLDQTMARWTFEQDLESTGLLSRVMESMGHKNVGAPVALRVVNNLPPVKNEDTGIFTNPEIPREEWAELRARHWLPTQGNLAWNWENPMVKQLLLACFPKAIDFGAYNHRLNAPLIPGGYFENMEIRFSNPMALDPEARDAAEHTQCALAEIMGEEILFERDQECDGAGLYDPDHPDVADLVARYGKGVFQVTILREDGLFAKGIIVPRQGINPNGGPAIHLDMAQVKGSHKGVHVEGEVVAGCFVGLMKSWDRQSYFPGSFELLEFVNHQLPQERALELELAMKSLVDEAVEDIAKDGVDGLMAEIARDDEQLKLIVKVVAQIRAHGENLNPMSIPMLKSAMEDKLRAKLWVIAQGAGIRGRQYVTVLDASVPEGTCVLRGFKVGSELAIWRFPCVLPQGLVCCKVIKPKPHHLIDEEIVPNTIWLNPRDLTARMQGDDDGDIVGVSNDPRVLTIFRARKFEGVYLIEPQGKKFEIGSDTKEGHKYLEVDPRGPVGKTTIWQAELLAVGDWWGALSMAVLNQEAIDAAKRCIEWTDIEKACERNMWVKGTDGNFKLLPEAKLDPKVYAQDPFEIFKPRGLLANWVSGRLKKHGLIRTKKVRQEPLAWRIQEELKDGKLVRLKKRINPSYMLLCEEKSSNTPEARWKGGNLVHQCHDMMVNAWKAMASTWDEMFQASDLTVSVRDLLHHLMKQRGVRSELTANSWEEYLELRKKAGIVEYGKKFRALLKKRVDESAKFGAIESLTQQLHLDLKQLSAADLATIWYWELTPTWQVDTGGQPYYTHEEPEGQKAYVANKANYAFRAVAFPGSPILPMLGIEDVQGCSWLLDQQRGTKMTEWVLKQPEPFKILSQRIFANETHGDTVVNENGRVELHQCKHCLDHLSNQVIRSYRALKSVGEKEAMKSLVTDLNKLHRPWGNNQYAAEDQDYQELQ